MLIKALITAAILTGGPLFGVLLLDSATPYNRRPRWIRPTLFILIGALLVEAMLLALVSIWLA